MIMNSRLRICSTRSVWITATVAATLALSTVIGLFGLRASLEREVGIPVMLAALVALATSSLVLYAALVELIERAAGRIATDLEEPAREYAKSPGAAHAGKLVPLAAVGVVLAIVPSGVDGETGIDQVILATALPLAYLAATAIFVARAMHASTIELASSTGIDQALAWGLAARGRELALASMLAALGAIVSVSLAADFAAWERVPVICFASAIGLAVGSAAGCETARRALARAATS